MNLTLYIYNGRARFFQIQDRNTRAKKYYPDTFKTGNGDVAMRSFFYATITEPTTPSYLFLKRRRSLI